MISYRVSCFRFSQADSVQKALVGKNKERLAAVGEMTPKLAALKMKEKAVSETKAELDRCVWLT